MESEQVLPDFLDPDRVKHLSELRDHARKELLRLGVEKTKHYYAVMGDLRNFAIELIGINDEYTALKAQSHLVKALPNLDSSHRRVNGDRWTVWMGVSSSSEKQVVGLDTLLENTDTKIDASSAFAYHPELIPLTQEIKALLCEHDYFWTHDYVNVDANHDEGGVEITGIREESAAKEICSLVIEYLGFPYSDWYFEQDPHRDPGWHIRAKTLALNAKDRLDLLDIASDELVDYLKTKKRSGTSKADIHYRGIEHVKLEVSSDLAEYVCEESTDSEFYPLLKRVREGLGDVGVLLPTVTSRISLNLPENSFCITIANVSCTYENPRPDDTARVLIAGIWMNTLDYQYR